MKNLFKYVLAVFLFAVSFWGITYTSDWINYEYYFNNYLTMKSDIASFLIFDYLKQHQYDYRVAFRVHIAIMSFLYPLVFVKMRQNPIPYTLILIIFLYVPIANQIRYYVALPLVLLAFISFYERKFIWSAIWLLLGISFQFTTIVLLSILLVYYFVIVRKRRFQRHLYYFSGGIILVVILSPLLSFFPEDMINDYSKYTNTENISSFIGGLYTMIPKLLALCFLFTTHKKVKHYYTDVIRRNERMYYLLWTFSVATAVLIPLGFSIQILVHRFISPMLVFQVMYFAYIGKNRTVRNNLHTNAMISVILLVTLLWQTLLPYSLHISRTPISTELLMILQSYQL